MTDTNKRAYVLHQIAEAGIKLIRLWFADVAGRLKEVAITSEQLDEVLIDGLGIDGGVMGGPTRDESELILVPDPLTCVMLPDEETARMFCDVVSPDGEPAPDDTRAVLKAALGRARDRGLTFYVGCEIEHFYFWDGELPLRPTDHGGRYHPGASDELTELKRETLLALEQLGVAVDSFHHEDAPGQYKVGIQYSDALSLADGLLTYRQVVRRMAERHGVLASFMPKPLTAEEGCGLHFSLSLVDKDGGNVFYDGDDPLGLTTLARQFVAGLLEHAPALSLLTNPTVNSYKRLVPGFSAPTACTWARAGRGDLVRIPRLQTGHGPTSTRLEYRLPDPSCNPYLALAGLLEAGLDGVDAAADPPPEREPDQPRLEAGPALPSHLAAAIDAAAASELLPRALGSALTAELTRAARAEWSSYHSQVGAWEVESYLR